MDRRPHGDGRLRRVDTDKRLGNLDDQRQALVDFLCAEVLFSGTQVVVFGRYREGGARRTLSGGLVEFVVIVISILAAFGLDAWWETQAENRRVHAQLEAVVEDTVGIEQHTRLDATTRLAAAR